jgi:hypothetical protein
MTPAETQSLANATCCWLAYKSLTGFHSMLSEATLALPIAEFLASRTSWILTSELSYKHLAGPNVLPDFWCDFAGRRKSGEGTQFILEAKFLKRDAKGASAGIAADFIRLSLPPGLRLKRYFLLAGQSKFFPKSDAGFLFGKNLFGLQPPTKGCYVTPSEEIKKKNLSAFRSSFVTVNGELDDSRIPKLAYVTCRAISEVPSEGDQGFKTIIWSVGRAKSPPTTTTDATSTAQ